MAKINPYLNFDGKAEEAFNFYKSVFGGEFMGEINRMSSAPGTEHLSDEEKNRVMHVALPIDGGNVLMASDIIPSMGHKLIEGIIIYACSLRAGEMRNDYSMDFRQVEQ